MNDYYKILRNIYRTDHMPAIDSMGTTGSSTGNYEFSVFSRPFVCNVGQMTSEGFTHRPSGALRNSFL